MVTFDEIEKADVSELSVRKKVEAFYKGTDAISNFADEVIMPVLRGQIDLNDKEKGSIRSF